MQVVVHSTRGVIGGDNSTIDNTIDYITIASTGNAKDFGDLQGLVARKQSILDQINRGLFGGGTNPSTNTIEYMTIATMGGNARFW